MLTQRVAKGKEIDTSANPIFKHRLLALHQHQLIAIFNKGFASLSDRALIHAHRLTLDRRSGLNPLAKAHYRRECQDSSCGVGQVFPG